MSGVRSDSWLSVNPHMPAMSEKHLTVALQLGEVCVSTFLVVHVWEPYQDRGTPSQDVRT